MSDSQDILARVASGDGEKEEESEESAERRHIMIIMDSRILKGVGQ